MKPFRSMQVSELLKTFGIAVCLIYISAVGAQSSPQFSNFRGDDQRTGRAVHTGPTAPTHVQRITTGGALHSSAAIGADGTAYFGSTDKRLYAVSAAGEVKWSYRTGDMVMSSPVIDNAGNIYFGSVDGYMYAMDPSGTLKWRTTTVQPPASPLSPIYSSPIVSSGSLLYSALSGVVFSTNAATGQVQWQYSAGTVIFSSPAVSHDGLDMYIGGTDGGLRCLGTDGTFKWNYQAGAKINTAPAVGADGAIYATSADGFLNCVNPDGSLRWQFATSPNIMSSPSIGADGTVYIGSYDGYLTAVSATGQKKWAFATRATIKSSPVIDRNGDIYFGTANGTVFSLGSNGGLRWSLAMGEDLDTTPGIGADGSLYFGLQDGTFCIISDGLGSVPEPSAFVVMLSGMSGVAMLVRRRKTRRA